MISTISFESPGGLWSNEDVVTAVLRIAVLFSDVDRVHFTEVGAIKEEIISLGEVRGEANRSNYWSASFLSSRQISRGEKLLSSLPMIVVERFPKYSAIYLLTAQPPSLARLERLVEIFDQLGVGVGYGATFANASAAQAYLLEVQTFDQFDDVTSLLEDRPRWRDVLADQAEPSCARRLFRLNIWPPAFAERVINLQRVDLSIQSPEFSVVGDGPNVRGYIIAPASMEAILSTNRALFFERD